jgi:ADP-ribosyl-[dinitrogen reductase] hydrolase
VLFEIAIGDAYGAGFEFSSRDKIERSNTLAAYVEHELGIPAGRYTDDTQMSIAVSEVLLSDATTGDAFADAFVTCYKRDRRGGYAKGLQALLDECQDGADLRARIRPESRRNGAAMRSVPLGLIPEKTRLFAAAQAQATVTHHTPEGILSSRVVAYMSHLLLYGETRVSDLPALVKSELGFELRHDWHQEVECDALQTLHAVNTALQRNGRMSDLLVDCVNFSGDVDSVAAIAMGLASLSAEYVCDVPNVLRHGLEDETYGATFLHGLDAALAGKFPVLQRRLRG